MKRLYFLVILCAFVFVSVARGDVVYLKNGRSMEGVVKSDTGDSVALDIGIGTVTFTKDEVARIEKSSAASEDALRQKWVAEQRDSDARRLEIQEAEE